MQSAFRDGRFPWAEVRGQAAEVLAIRLMSHFPAQVLPQGSIRIIMSAYSFIAVL